VSARASKIRLRSCEVNGVGIAGIELRRLLDEGACVTAPSRSNPAGESEAPDPAVNARIQIQVGDVRFESPAACRVPPSFWVQIGRRPNRGAMDRTEPRAPATLQPVTPWRLGSNRRESHRRMSRRTPDRASPATSPTPAALFTTVPDSATSGFRVLMPIVCAPAVR
jgi:hypothetical protein